MATEGKSQDKVLCLTVDGFKWTPKGGSSRILGRHVELELDPEEFEQLRAQGLVDLPENVRQRAAATERQHAEEIESAQAAAQKEWDQAHKDRLAQAEAREEQRLLAEAAKQDRLAKLTRARTNRGPREAHP